VGQYHTAVWLQSKLLLALQQSCQTFKLVFSIL